MPRDKIAGAISKMTDEQIIKAYIDLAQHHYQKYRDRRDLEWRIHLTLWTFLALIAYLDVTNGLHHLVNIAYAIFLVVPLHFIWMAKIHRGEILEHSLSIRYRNEAERVLRNAQFSTTLDSSDLYQNAERAKIPRWMDKGFESYRWWLIAELSMTFLLCAGVWLLIREP